MSDVARACGLPFSTAHRLLGGLAARGYVLSPARGEYRLGIAAMTLAQNDTLAELLAAAARPVLRALSRQCRVHAHLGILEDDMVTYLVKQPYGRRRLLSTEGTQLEAYCSAVGKVLLAHLDTDQLEAYLSAGPFVALTRSTIIDPTLLKCDLTIVRARGWGVDAGEIAVDLACVAVPICDNWGRILAALSISITGASAPPIGALPMLRDAATAITRKLFPMAVNPLGLVS